MQCVCVCVCVCVFLVGTLTSVRVNFQLVRQTGVRISPMGIGTWSWGNQFLWGYEEDMDPELQQVFNLVVSQGSACSLHVGATAMHATS